MRVSLFFLFCIALTLFCSIPTTLALREDEAGHHDWYLPRIGIPRTDANTANPGKVGPRFHKLLRPGMNRRDKGQTAIYTVTESNVITALNPKNGGIVWRQIFDEDDTIHAFWTIYEAVLVISGQGGSKVRLFHALSGHLLWETVQHYPADGLLTATAQEAGLLVDADFLTYGRAPSAYTLANGDAVRRLDWHTGEVIWHWTKPEEDAPVILGRVLLAGDHVHVFGFRKITSLRSSLIGSSETDASSTVIHYILTADDGRLLRRAELPTPVGAGGPGDVGFATLGAGRMLTSHLIWLGRDGALRSIPLTSSSNETAALPAVPNPSSLYPKTSGARFTQLLEVGLRDKALFVAKRNDHKAEVVRLEGKGGAQPKINREWEWEEEAPDAVYSGAYDRENKGYVNRVFFQRSQHLLNFHVYWADIDHYGERGQITGFSFQYDHDLNGDVLAAPFEGNPVSPYQMITRSVFATASGSLRLIQEDKHQWMREESLTQIQAATFVDLPELKLSTLFSPAQAQRAALGLEGWGERLSRHLGLLKNLPEWVLEFAGRFVSGVEEESWNFPRREAEEDGREHSSTLATAGPRKGQMEEVAGPAALGPRTLRPNETAQILRKDPFGLRKVIVAGTSRGKLYAIDGAARGKVLWEKSLVGYGPGEGGPAPKVTFKGIFHVRSLAEASTSSAAAEGDEEAPVQSPLLSIIAEVEEDGMLLTRVFQLDALSGRFVDGREVGTPVVIGAAKDVFALPVVDEGSGRRALGVVGSENQLVLIPETQSVVDAFSKLANKFYFSLPTTSATGIHGLEGFTIGGASRNGKLSSTKVWSLQFAEGEHIVDVLSASEDPVASQGKVLGNRKTLYKYLNPHARVVTTLSLTEGTAGVYLIDGVTGRILFETKARGVDVGQPIRAVFVENWIVVSYVVSGAADPKSQRILSVEVYDGVDAERGLFQWTDVFSSFGRTSRSPSPALSGSKASANTTQPGSGGGAATSPELRVFQQTFIAPWSITQLGFTRTKHGISTKSLLAATNLNQIVHLNRRLLDPRRPVGRKPSAEEAEEMLFAYEALLPFEPKWTLSHIFPVSQVRAILSTPASIESTSLVFAHGLDSYVSRVAPSGAFDILSASFNKAQLSLTVLALATGIIVTKPLLRNKALKARW